MHFKSIFAGAATAVTLAATALVSAPAQAATITEGSILNLNSVGLTGGGVQRSDNTLDFFSATLPFVGTVGQETAVAVSTGSFTGANIASPIVAPLPRIRDLTLTATATPDIFTSGPIADFITGVDIVTGLFPPSTAPVSFDLQSFTYNAANGDATFNGLFKSEGFVIAGTGKFTSQLGSVEVGNGPSSYSASITAVPTPALLPGLIAVGVGALRKRRAKAIASKSC